MEFNDERINSALAKIYRNGMIIATIITLAYALLRAVYLNANDALLFKYMLTEGAMSFCSLIIIVIGLIKFIGKKDERVEREMAQYYLKGAKVFLIVTISAYAISIPYSRGKGFADMPLNILMNTLIALAYVYIYYNFRRNNIELNYSIINNSTGKYLLLVLANIGKFALGALVPFFIAGIIDLFVNKSIVFMFATLASGAASVITIGSEYFFISLVEKLYYNDERPVLFKRGLIIFAIMLIVAVILKGLLDLAFVLVAEFGMNYEGIIGALGERLAEISTYRKTVTYFYVTTAVAPLLCSFAAQLADGKCFKLLKAWSTIIMIQVADAMLISPMITVISRRNDEALRDYSLIMNNIGYVYSVLFIVMAVILIRTLIKNYNMTKLLRIIPVLSAIALAFTLFASTQRSEEVIQYSNLAYGFASQLTIYLIYYISVKKYDKKCLQNNINML